MKKLIAFCMLATVSLINLGLTTARYASPKLYPELDNFFKSVKGTAITDGHNAVLKNVTSYLISGALGDKVIYVVYSCPDNSLRSLAAQIFTQSLMGVYKYKKVKVVSFGTESAPLSSDLLGLLTSAGYKVSAKDNGTLEVKYSDELPAILVKTTMVGDASLPKSGFLSVSLCAPEENCKPVSGAAFSYVLDFKRPKAGDDAAAEFKQIAGEIYYAANKAYESYHP